MTTTPVWFGPADRSLFGWLHHPDDGRARAGVVICPPIGHEYLQVHYALRLLAERFSAHGLCALRFDYDGTGDSAGSDDDPDRVGAMIGSIAEAIELLRSTGVTEISLIGMRLGALFAAQVAAERDDIDQLVLWDPCISGRSFLAEQRALSAISSGLEPSGDGSASGPGFSLRPDSVRQLADLGFDGLRTPLARRSLVLSRPDRFTVRQLGPLLSGHVDWTEAVGQAELLDVGLPGQSLPIAAIDQATDWVSKGAAPDPILLRAPKATDEATIYVGLDGCRVTERAVWMGPARLFGIATEGAPGSQSGSPTAVFLNVANEHHVGPGRLWVELARRWASAGISSVRVDMSGLGDSPCRTPGQKEFVVHAPECFEDVDDIAAAISPDDPTNVLLIGLSSSGYQVLESALGLQPRGIVAVNPSLSFVPPEHWKGQPVDPRRQIARSKRRVGFRQSLRMTTLYLRARSRFPRLRMHIRSLRRYPRLHRIRSLIDSAGWMLRSHRPATWIGTLVDAGVDILLVCGEDEARPLRTGITPRLLESGKLHFEYLPELEHALLIEEDYRMVADLVTSHVVGRFAQLRQLDRRQPAVGPATFARQVG
jgi:pimeloyl-ACP methyl ester carboxylesterase